ncbi:acetyltransferase [Chelatococcus sambhunathii]|uniref:Acetyltransferase n=1 Tax=Chelatococcus sambhunathii TaxID=363953 RepID=A0ABU1DJ72_9HYPH|nr:GNAT family N-acetyltransferase [Chelatococcus sambhunathii]MDR4308172.1 acetyltransferase [Chelatococcus sambhunathii]
MSELLERLRPAAFERVDPMLGRFAMRPLDVARDGATIVDWVKRPYALYWNMGAKSEAEILDFYEGLMASPHATAMIGEHAGAPAFLSELYDPAHDQVGEHYDPLPGDRGMHVLVAPAERPIPGFTLAVVRTIMAFIFEDPDARRVVVEPDIRNEKIHALNLAVGFIYDRPLAFREKTAHLAFCTRAQFLASLPDGGRQ